MNELLLPPPLEDDEELGDLSAPPRLDERIRDLSLVSDLDVFFSHLHEYHREQGLFPYLSSRLCNLAALAFTILCSFVLLLAVDWRAIHDPCVRERTCDLSDVMFRPDPLRHGSYAWRCGVLTYLLLFSVYWVWGLASFALELGHMATIRAFLRDRVGVSDGEITSLSWPEILDRVLRVQATTRLSLTSRDLTHLDAVARIMRKDHFFMGLIHARALDLSIDGLLAAFRGDRARQREEMPPDASGPSGFSPLTRERTKEGAVSMMGAAERSEGCGSGSGSGQLASGTLVLPSSAHFLFTHTLEWNLRWVLLDWMLGPKHRLKPASLLNAWTLRRRLRLAALLNLAVSPFLAVFLCIFYFLRNAEHFYHHPGSAGARRWSPLAHWLLREWNELGPQLESRIDQALPAAERYVAQFRSRSLVYCARLVSFLAGSFAALILALALVDDDLLERPLYGRNLVWWAAAFGVVLAVARGLADEEPRAHDPEGCLTQVTAMVRYRPRHWAGRAHKAAVYAEVVAMVPPRPLLFLQELLSVATNPLLLGVLLPSQAERIVAHLAQCSERAGGLGDVMDASRMDLGRSGSEGGRLADSHTSKATGHASDARARPSSSSFTERGRVERSLLSFCITYPTWDPGPEGKSFLRGLGAEWMPGRGVTAEGGGRGPTESSQRKPRSDKSSSFRFLAPSDSVVLHESATSSDETPRVDGTGAPPLEGAAAILGGELTPTQVQNALLSMSMHKALSQSQQRRKSLGLMPEGGRGVG